jgi:hypothetical protein
MGLLPLHSLGPTRSSVLEFEVSSTSQPIANHREPDRQPVYALLASTSCRFVLTVCRQLTAVARSLTDPSVIESCGPRSLLANDAMIQPANAIRGPGPGV